LKRDSIIETKGFRGTYVHPKAKANCKFNLQEWTLRKLSESIDELREAGVTDSEIRNAFAAAINRQAPAKQNFFAKRKELMNKGSIPAGELEDSAA
jgi:GntR family transcriptional regulator